jgi:hypothetical protein
MWLKRTVVMLPTNQEAIRSGIYLYNNKLSKLYIATSGNDKDIISQPQHLYILSDENIVEGDWCINSYDNQIWQYKPSPCPMPYWGNKNTLRKIIATTDTNLIALFGNDGEIYGKMKEGLPQLSQSFLNKFIEQYNKGVVISDIMVEYDEEPTDDGNADKYAELHVKPKVNTVIIRSMKDSWSKDEVIGRLRTLENDLHLAIYPRYDDLSFRQTFMDNWINNNL